MSDPAAQGRCWYYADGSEKHGPFSEEQMQGFLATQIIHAETLVWKKSLLSWQSFRNSSLASSNPKTPPPYRGDTDVLPLYKRRSLWMGIIGTLILLGAVSVIIWHVQNYRSESANEAASTPLTSEPQAVAAPSTTPVPPQAVQPALPSPTPTPSQEVSSSNPIIYTGSFINGSTGDNGTLTLKVEHLIRTGEGQIAIGGELITDGSSTSITGTYSPDAREISFSPGVQSQVEWKGNISGESIKGTFSRHQTYSAEESGIWQVRHSEGPLF